MESLLADPLAVRGLMAAIIIGAVAPVLGCYVVLRGMAFFGDALAHIVLPGVVIAFLLGWPLLVGALIAGVLAALLINLISGATTLKEDSAIGVVFVAAIEGGFDLLAENNMNEPVIASPVAVSNRLFIRGRRHLFCVEAP